MEPTKHRTWVLYVLYLYLVSPCTLTRKLDRLLSCQMNSSSDYNIHNANENKRKILFSVIYNVVTRRKWRYTHTYTKERMFYEAQIEFHRVFRLWLIIRICFTIDLFPILLGDYCRREIKSQLSFHTKQKAFLQLFQSTIISKKWNVNYTFTKICNFKNYKEGNKCNKIRISIVVE